MFFGAFVVQFILVGLRLCLRAGLFGDVRWPEGLLVVLATGTTLAWLTRGLPGQNVMMASMIIAFIAGVVESVAALTGIPFGPFNYTENIGQELFHPLPWAMPLVWIVIVLNARGVARLLLRPWRRGQNYGLWIIGVTSALVAVLDLGLEPYATRVKQYWLWGVSKTSLQWYHAPWVNFFGWAVTTVIILAFATPSLVNKAPVKQAPPADWFPLVVWLMLNFLFAAGAFLNQLWPAVAVVIVSSALVAGFAAWSGRDEPPTERAAREYP